MQSHSVPLYLLVSALVTLEAAAQHDVQRNAVKKIAEGRPHIVDHLLNGEIAIVVNTPMGGESMVDDGYIRTTSLRFNVPCITTISGAMAAAEGIRALREGGLSARSLQSLYVGSVED